MLHGAQDRAATSGHLQAREAEEKHYAGALRGGTLAPETTAIDTQTPATEWLARDLSYIFKGQQEALAILGDLYTKLTGEKSPGYPISGNGKEAQPSSGLFRELAISMNTLKDQSSAVVNLAMTINRAI